MEFWSQLRREEIRLPLKRLHASVGGQVQLNTLLTNWLMVDSLLRLTIVILLLVNSWNVYQDKYKTGPRHIISAFLSFRHLILSHPFPVIEPICQFSMRNCFCAFKEWPSHRREHASQDRLANSYCSELLSSRKKLASAKTSVSKQESRAY